MKYDVGAMVERVNTLICEGLRCYCDGKYEDAKYYNVWASALLRCAHEAQRGQDVSYPVIAEEFIIKQP